MYGELKILRHYLRLKKLSGKILILFFLASGTASGTPATIVSPAGIAWQFSMNDVDGGSMIGLGEITLEDGGALDGYMILRGAAIGGGSGFFILTGSWGERPDGRVDAFLSGDSDAACGPEGETFSIETLHGAAKSGKKGLSLALDGKAGGRRVSIDGAEAVALDDLSADLTAQTKKAAPGQPGGTRFAELVRLAPSTLGFENLYDVTGTGLGYALFGCALAGRNGRLALTAQQDDDDSIRTLLGKASTKKIALTGGDDATDPMNVTMVMK